MSRRSRAIVNSEAISSPREVGPPAPALRTRHALEVHVFGRFRVETLGRRVAGLSGSRSRELLAYLLVHRDRSHRREAVADRLWGETVAGDLRKTMRQALWQVQSALPEGRPLIESLGGDWIGIRPDCDLWLDLETFESAWREIETVPGGDLSADASGRARQALELCRGELLEGCDWEWCRIERERLRDLSAVMVDKLMEWCQATGAHATGIRLGTDLLRVDPARERTHLDLMRLYARANDRTSALRQYRRCAEALRHELGVAPAQPTRELWARLREGSVEAPGAAKETRRDAGRDVAETAGSYKWTRTGLSKRPAAPNGAAP